MRDTTSGDDEFQVDEDWVQYEVVEPHIAIITINRPDRRNAILSPEMHASVQGAARPRGSGRRREGRRAGGRRQ